MFVVLLKKIQIKQGSCQINMYIECHLRKVKNVLLVDSLFCFEAVGTQDGQCLELGVFPWSASTGTVKDSSLTNGRTHVSLHIPQKLPVKHLGFFYFFVYLTYTSFTILFICLKCQLCTFKYT